MASLAIACTRIVVHLKAPLTPHPHSMPRVLYCLSSQLPRITAALIRLALSEILCGMLTADRPEKRRQATRGSLPAAVVPT
eukprot:scaffold46599_cov57-Cyclotella_meneghiniana.AAC.1